MYEDARRDIDEGFARLTAAPTSVIATIKHDHHRARRIPLQPFFSKQSIAKFEPFIWSRVQLLVKKLKQAHKTDHVVELVDCYGALTTDVISRYAYGETFDYLGKETDLEFKNDYMHAVGGLNFVSPISRHFPLVGSFMRCLPQWALQTVSPNFGQVNKLLRWCRESAIKILQAAESDAKDNSVKPNNIFEALLSPDMPPEEKTLQRLTDEGFVITIAGLETTARYLTNTTTHLLLNPDCLSKLRAELKTVMPAPGDCPPGSVLENLPYLVSISSLVNEWGY